MLARCSLNKQSKLQGIVDLRYRWTSGSMSGGHHLQNQDQSGVMLVNYLTLGTCVYWSLPIPNWLTFRSQRLLLTDCLAKLCSLKQVIVGQLKELKTSSAGYLSRQQHSLFLRVCKHFHSQFPLQVTWTKPLERSSGIVQTLNTIFHCRDLVNSQSLRQHDFLLLGFFVFF